MRAGVSTVQQTLTTEAANVLKLSVAEAQRRGHAQVTPLHVATTLLSGNSSVLRQACVQSHLHLPQPPHCRNLELCFKVALDRLQTTTTTSGSQTPPSAAGANSQSPAPPAALGLIHHPPPSGGIGHHQQSQPSLSNALVAALKRAQAHQRRGYPEQQQVPLLAVKVEMEQLIISILDDPSVSRVMREASFSSTHVKSSLEEALAAAAASSAGSSTCAAQARRILPSIVLAASPTPAAAAAQSVDRLRLKLGSLEQYAAAAASLSSLSSSPAAAGGTSTGTARGACNADSSNYHSMSISSGGGGRTGISSGGGKSGRMSADVGRVVEVLLKSKKRNPLLFGEQSPHGVAEEVLQRLERGDSDHSMLRGMRTVTPQFASIALGLHARDEVELKLGDLVRAVDKSLLVSSGVLVYLGDLQWLVERSSPASPSSTATSSPVYCPVQHAVNEIGKLVAAQGNRVWLMAVASSQTYMRCQARHPALDSLWGLQPLPISTGFNLSLRNPNISNGRFGVDSPAAAHRAAPPGRWPVLPPFKLQQQMPPQPRGEEDGTGLSSCCSECVGKYEQELHDGEKRSEESAASNGLPFWLKPSKESSEQQSGRPQRAKELQKKWSQACRSLHGGAKLACGTLPMSIPWLSLQPQIGGGKGTAERNGLTIHAHGKDVGSVSNRPPEDVLSTDIGLNLKPSSNGVPRSTEQPQQQPQTESEVTVQTDLILGRSSLNSKLSSTGNGVLSSLFEKTASSVPEKQRYQPMLPAQAVPPLITVTSSFKPPPAKDMDFKALCKALTESVPWQKDAADSIASTLLSCRSGNGEKRRGSNFRYDAWLLLLGSDPPAKRRVARVVAEQVFGSDKMLFRLSLSSNRDHPEAASGPGRGRTPLDKLAEAVRSKPFSVILLEDIEQADPRLKTALMKAVERGRLADSSGREVSVANLIVVMTSSVGEEVFPRREILEEAEVVGMKLLVEEAAAPELVSYTSGRVSVVRSGPDSPKRKTTANKFLDLNMPDNGDVLFEEVDEPVSEDGQVKLLLERAEDHLSKQFLSKMSGTVVFKPFNFEKLAELVVSEVNTAVSASKLSIEVESGLLKHLVSVLWEGKHEEFQKWMIQVLDTSAAEQLKSSSDQHVIRLVADRDVVPSKRIKVGDGGT